MSQAAELLAALYDIKRVGETQPGADVALSIMLDKIEAAIEKAENTNMIIPTAMPVWHPHTEKITKPQSAIIAVRAEKQHPTDVGIIILPELYATNSIKNGKATWEGQWEGEPLKDRKFWWMDESELVDSLERLIGTAAGPQRTKKPIKQRGLA